MKLFKLLVILFVLVTVFTGCKFFNAITGEDQCRIRVDIVPESGGTVELSETGMVYAVEPVGGVYYEGETVTLTATAETDDEYIYYFDYWKGGSISGVTNPVVSMPIETTVDIEAQFYAEKFIVDAPNIVEPGAYFPITITAVNKNGTITGYNKEITISPFNAPLAVNLSVQESNIVFTEGVATAHVKLDFQDTNNTYGYSYIVVSEKDDDKYRGLSEIVTLSALPEYMTLTAEESIYYNGEEATLTATTYDEYDNQVSYTGKAILTIENVDTIGEVSFSKEYINIVNGSGSVTGVFSGGYGELRITAEDESGTFSSALYCSININQVPPVEAVYIDDADTDTELKLKLSHTTIDGDEQYLTRDGIMIVRSEEPFNIEPTGDYNTDDSIGNGIVVYKNADIPIDFTDTGLTPHTQYYYTAYSYFDDGVTIRYSEPLKTVGVAKKGKRLWFSADSTASEGGTHDNPAKLSKLNYLLNFYQQPNLVYRLSAGDHNVTSPVSIDRSISIIGGFTTDWTDRKVMTKADRDNPLYSTTINQVGEDVEFPIEVIASNVLIEGLNIYGGSNTTISSGVSIKGNDTSVTLRYNTIHGGSGTDNSYGVIIKAGASAFLTSNHIDGGDCPETSRGVLVQGSVCVCENNYIMAGDNTDDTDEDIYKAYAVQSEGDDKSNLYFYSNEIIGGLCHESGGTIALDNSDCIFDNNIIRGGTTKTTSTDHAYTIHFGNGKKQFINNTIYAPEYAAEGISMVFLIDDTSDNIEIDISGNIIYGGVSEDTHSYVIYKNMNSGITGSITNNFIYGGSSNVENNYTAGIYFASSHSGNKSEVDIIDNYIIGGVGANSYYSYGIYLADNNSGTIAGNTIYAGIGGDNNAETYGIYCKNTSDTIDIINNIIHGGNVIEGNTCGIYLSGVEDAYIINNTIYNGSSGNLVNLEYCIKFVEGSNPSNPYIANNILFNEGGGTNVGICNDNSTFKGIKNNLFYNFYTNDNQTSDYHVINGMGVYKTVEQLNNGEANASGNIGAESTANNPNFVDGDGIDDDIDTIADNDWHLSSSTAQSIYEGALDDSDTDVNNSYDRVYGIGITVDKDGKDRGTSGWSMGAYEYDN